MPRARIRDLLLVGIGGALGTLARAACVPLADGWIRDHLGQDAWVQAISLGTLVVNVLGAFLLGVLVAAVTVRGAARPLMRAVRLALGTGVLGGFTTYSMFAGGTAQLLLAGNLGGALVAVCGTMVVGCLASWGGWVLGSRVTPPPRSPGLEVAPT